MAVAILLVTDVVGLAVHGGGGAQSIRATLAQASAHTLSSGTARIELSVHIRVTAAGMNQTVNEAMQGEGDLTHRLIDMTTESGPAAGVELRLIDGVAYEKVPPGLPRPPGVTTPWISVATGLPGSVATIPGVQGGSDPTQTLSQLQSLSNGSITGAQKLGASVIKGTSTTEYRLDLDVAKMQAQAQAGAASLGGVTGVSVPSMTFHSMSETVWVDAQGLIRQQRVTADMSVSIRGFQARSQPDVTVDYWDFGLPVDIQAPPASLVTPVSSLAPSPASAA